MDRRRFIQSMSVAGLATPVDGSRTGRDLTINTRLTIIKQLQELADELLLFYRDIQPTNRGKTDAILLSRDHSTGMKLQAVHAYLNQRSRCRLQANYEPSVRTIGDKLIAIGKGAMCDAIETRWGWLCTAALGAERDIDNRVRQLRRFLLRCKRKLENES